MKKTVEEGIKKKKIVKFLLSDITYATRDKKEIELLNSMGCEVLVYCSGERSEIYITDSCITVQKIERLKLSYTQSKFSRILKIIERNILLIKTLRSFKADCISCHDLEALFLGWLSGFFMFEVKRPLLVYDSHEFEAGRNTAGKRGRIKQWSILHLERFLMRKTAFNMMVNDTIAEEVKKMHHLREKPLVVRNIPAEWDPKEEICREQRIAFCHELQLPEDTFLLMYHGVLTNGRGIENVVRAIAGLEKVAVILLGYGESSYVATIKSLIKSLGVEKKVLFHSAVPQGELWQFIGAADAGMVLIENVCLSYYYSLPNKLFENIQSLTPVIGSNFPEISQIIDSYEIGLCCNPSDPREIATTIEAMRTDKDKYAFYKKRLGAAKKELSWENEKIRLQNAYTTYL